MAPNQPADQVPHQQKPQSIREQPRPIGNDAGSHQRLHQADKHSFIHQHSLGITSIAIVVALIFLYIFSNPSTHLGGFFGNAIADWSGVVVTVFATKYLYERGSAESRRMKGTVANPVLECCREHSLSIFLLITGIGWVVLYAAMDSNSKWGQVVGNIVSEWTQIFGLVLLTKKLIEKHSKESAQ